jgi:hypothetical protein
MKEPITIKVMWKTFRKHFEIYLQDTLSTVYHNLREKVTSEISLDVGDYNKRFFYDLLETAKKQNRERYLYFFILTMMIL